MLQVGGPEEISLQREGAGYLGDINVAAMSFDGYGAVNAVEGDASVVIVHVQGNAVVDRADIHIPMVGGDRYGCCDLTDIHVSVIRLNRNWSRMRNGEG